MKTMRILEGIKNAPYALSAAATVAVFSASDAMAQASNKKTVGDIATTLTGQIGAIGQLILGGAFLVGLGFTVTGLMRLKAAMETQGQQVKYSEGLMRLGIGIFLVAVPAVIMIGQESAGIDGKSGSIGGLENFKTN